MRRANTQISKKTLFVGVGVLLFLASLGYYLLGKHNDTFQRLEKLDVTSYSQSAKTFQGGVYFVEGTMDEVLLAKTGQGKLISLAISSPKGVVLIPLLIPDNTTIFNLEKGQNLKIKVKGIERGLLKAEKIEKAS